MTLRHRMGAMWLDEHICVKWRGEQRPFFVKREVGGKGRKVWEQRPFLCETRSGGTGETTRTNEKGARIDG